MAALTTEAMHRHRKLMRRYLSAHGRPLRFGRTLSATRGRSAAALPGRTEYRPADASPGSGGAAAVFVSAAGTALSVAARARRAFGTSGWVACCCARSSDEAVAAGRRGWLGDGMIVTPGCKRRAARAARLHGAIVGIR